MGDNINGFLSCIKVLYDIETKEDYYSKIKEYYESLELPGYMELFDLKERKDILYKRFDWWKPEWMREKEIKFRRFI